MNRVKEFIKKYHVIPYVIIVLVIAITAYVVKWYHHGEVVGALGDEAYVVYGYFNVILALALVGFTLVYALVVCKAAVEKIYLAGGIVSGILFMLLITPLSAADEDNHAYKCYDFSNILWGYEMPDNEQEHWLRACDANTELDREISINNYYYTAKNLFAKADAEEMVLKNVGDIAYDNKDVIYYFPAVLGISLGRVAGLSDVAIFMLGRLFLFAVYMIITYYAVKKIPVFKAGFALVMLMPSVISRAAAITYDGLLMAYLFVFIANVLYYCHNQENIKLRDAIILGLTGIAITVGKGGAYIPFLLLLFLIPREKFGTKIKYPVIVISSILVCLLAYCMCNLSLFTDIANSTKGAANDLAWTEEEGYTLKYILTHPKQSFVMLVKSIIDFGYKWYGEMIGDGYGWHQIYLSPIWSISYTILLVISGINVKGEEICLEKRHRYVFTGVIVLSSVLVILSMWMFWTPLGYDTIAGVQGRYFIPMLMLLVLMLKNKTIVMKKDLSKGLMLASYLITVGSCFNIWIGC